MYPIHPTVVEMLVVARQDEVARSLRDARRGRRIPSRHVLRRARTDAV